MQIKTEVDTTLTVAEIMAIHRVSRATAWRAKQRGYLFGTSYHNRGELAAPADHQKRFREICQHPAINISNLTMARHRSYDVINGKDMTKAEWKQFRTDILALRKAIRQFTVSGRHEHLITHIKENSLIKFTVLFRDLPDMTNRLSVGLDAYAEEIKEARILCKKFQICISPYKKADSL